MKNRAHETPVKVNWIVMTKYQEYFRGRIGKFFGE